MLKFYFNKKIVIGFFVALTILSWLAVSSYLGNRKLVRARDMIAHTLDVLLNTERVLATVTNIELGQRGFTITQNEEFLQPYRQAKESVEKSLDNLSRLTTDNPAQQERIASLKKDIAELLIFSEEVVQLRRRDLKAAQERNASLKGKKLMDKIRSDVANIEREENLLLNERYKQTEVQLQNFNYTFIGLVLATGLIVTTIFFAINLNLRSRNETQEKLSLALKEVNDLYDNAPCGYHSLDADGYFVNVNNTLAAWLGYKKEEIIGKKRFTDVIPKRELPQFHENFERFKQTGSAYNIEFNFLRKDGTEFPIMLNAIAIHDSKGQYTKSRSITFDNSERKASDAKINNLNRELEAFTYSVSHDLRAPLRSIDGYTKILQEDYSDKLDAEGNRILGVVVRNAKKMGKLIDDLLDFARLGRKELLCSRIDMYQLVNSVIRDQLEFGPAKKIKIEIKPLSDAQGDTDMIRQVWENLISNAVKYSGKKENPRVQISSYVDQGEVVYKVSDNGVGFDMTYAPKLFGVFQRLHKMEEFGGTGVGLAIVKRVIERHQGRVWAEAKVDDGATFYFTIPNENGKQ